MSGTLIVLEGIDGSGKSTQYAMLTEYLRSQGVGFKQLVFPRYSEDSSALVRMYLSGRFGEDPSCVNAYAASAFYAVDRVASYLEDWKDYYLSGGLVITDRYTTSNAIHQGAKLDPPEREAYIKWLFDFEYGLMGLPEPNRVVVFDMPVEVSDALLRDRQKKTGEKGDIHEKDRNYRERCRAASYTAAKLGGWSIIECSESGRIKPPEAIHREVLDIIRKEISL